jgi:hypothetical protein
LANTNWDGHIVAEVNTRKAKSEAERLELLVRTLDFAREHTAAAGSTASPLVGELTPIA